MRFLYILLIIGLLPASGCGDPGLKTSEEKTDTAAGFSAQEKQAVEDNVKDFMKELYRAWNEGEYGHAFSLYDHPSGLFGSEIMDSWENRMAKEKENLALLSRFTQQLDSIVVHPISQDAAVVIGKDQYEAVSKEGQEQKGTTTFSLVVARVDSAWRIVHFHVVSP